MTPSALRRLWKKKTTATGSKLPRIRRMFLEQLESRQLLTSTIVANFEGNSLDGFTQTIGTTGVVSFSGPDGFLGVSGAYNGSNYLRLRATTSGQTIQAEMTVPGVMAATSTHSGDQFRAHGVLGSTNSTNTGFGELVLSNLARTAQDNMIFYSSTSPQHSWSIDEGAKTVPEDGTALIIAKVHENSGSNFDLRFGIDYIELMHVPRSTTITPSPLFECGSEPVATFSTFDLDLGDSFSYSVQNVVPALNNVNGGAVPFFTFQNQLWAVPGFDYETYPGPYTVTVRTTDSDGLFRDDTFVISVTDVAPTQPTDLNSGANTVAEGAASGTSVGIQLHSTDPCGGNVHYALADDAGGRFAVNPNSGVVTVNNSSLIDYETFSSWPIRVQAIDDAGAASNPTTAVMTIAVTNVNPSTPVDANPVPNQVAEGASFGTTVGITASSTDPNGPAVTYSLTDNADGRFFINNSSGVVSVANGALLNYESATSHNITVQASDGRGGTSTQTFSIAVTNVAPSTPIDNDGTPNQVAEGAGNGTQAGITASSTDPNGPPVTYSLTDNPGGRFAIDSSTGVVTVANSSLLDGPGAYSVTVAASDGQLSTPATFSIAVANTAPSAMLSNSGPVNEGSTASVSFSSQFDPSSADTSAGFHYAYDFDNDGTWEIGNGMYSGSPITISATVPALYLDDNPSRVVKARIIDKDNGSTDYTTTITVNNVAPTATGIAGPTSLGQNETGTYSLAGVLDPSTIDSQSLHYSFSTDADSLATSYGQAGVVNSFSASFSSGGNETIYGRVFDKDGDSNTYSLPVLVNNPPVIGSNNAAVSENEGSQATNAGTFSDPNGNSTVTIGCTAGSVTKSDADGTWTWSLDVADGPAGPTSVTCTATDDFIAASQTTFTYSVANVAPSISLSGATSVDEGSLYTLGLGAVTDPGQDTITSYSIDWGDGHTDSFTGNPANTTKQHTYDDGPTDQTYQVSVIDEDGTFLGGAMTIHVLNVNPAASFSASSSITYGDDLLLSLNAPSDPSDADTAAGFRYAFGYSASNVSPLIGAVYAAGSPDAAANVSSLDAGTYYVFGRIIDKDDGYTEYSQQVTVAKAASTTTVTCDAGPFGYNGSPHTPCTASVSGAGGLSQTLPVSYSDNINAGTATASASFPGDANHISSNGSATFDIAQATPTFATSGYTGGTYDGNAYTQTVTVTGVPADGQLYTTSLSGTNAGSYSQNWSYSSSNYSPISGTLAFNIAQAIPTFAYSGYTGGTYDGDAHTQTVTVTGIPAEGQLYTTSLSGTNAGSYSQAWSFSSNSNYSPVNGTLAFDIAKASSMVTVDCSQASETYDGAAHTPCTASVSGAGGLSQSLSVTYSDSVNAGSATASVSFDGDPNHTSSSGSATFAIAQATSTVTVDCSQASETYNGAAHTPCTASVSGAGGLSQPLSVTYSDSVNAGTVTASASFDGDANHTSSSGSAMFAIAKASSTVTVDCSQTSETYNGAAHTPCTASVSGASGLSQSLSVGYADNINAGTATASAGFDGDANHASSNGSAMFAIAQATPTFAYSGSTGDVYDGNARTQTVTVSGVSADGQLYTTSLSGTNAGSYSQAWSFSSGNYSPVNGTLAFAIAQASSTVTVDCSQANETYNGAAHTPCTASASGAGGLSQSLSVTYADNINAGTATASAGFDGDANHTGNNRSVTFAIAQATPTFAYSGYTGGTYDGNAHTQTVTVSGIPAEGQLYATSLSGTNAGSYSQAWSFSSGNYSPVSGTLAFDIAKANANITVTGYSGTYDGMAHGATGSASGVESPSSANLTILLHLGSSFSDAPGGTAFWTFDGDANYNASNGDVAIDISQATPTFAYSGYTGGAYDGNAHTQTLTVSGIPGEGQLYTTSLSGTNAGSYSQAWSFSSGNYSPVSGTLAFDIAKANANITVTGYSGTYDAAAHGATGSASGVESPSPANLTSLLHLGSSYSDAPGGTAFWTFDGDANYNASNGNVAIDISKATQTITWSNPAPINYGTPLSGTQLNATVTGVPGGSAPGALTYSPAAGTILSAGNQTLTVIAAATTNYNAASASVTLTVQPTINTLIGQVNVLVTSGILNGGNGNALLAKLQAANASFSAGNTVAGVNQLGAFINQVNAFVKSGKLTVAQAQPLIDAANQIIALASAGGAALVIDAPSNAATTDTVPVSHVAELVSGTIGVYLDKEVGNVTADEQARFEDALTSLNEVVGKYGMTLIEISAANAVNAVVRVNIASTSVAGSAADGVLGCTIPGQITLVTGWNWYTGSDPAAINAGQYDFQTIVTHELGHAIGLGHSGDASSVMFAYLGSAEARRGVTTQDLSVIETDAGQWHVDPLLAAGYEVREGIGQAPNHTDKPSRAGDSAALLNATFGSDATLTTNQSSCSTRAQEWTRPWVSNQDQSSRAVMLTSVLLELGLTGNDGAKTSRFFSEFDANVEKSAPAVDEVFAENGDLLLGLL